MPILRRLVLPLFLAAATIAVFDLVAWFVVPEQMTSFASAYRRVALLEGGGRYPALARAYPPNYFRADPATGFDIAPLARASHAFDFVPIPIWANRLGCYDRNEPEDFARKPYAYFAGDSFTWGYADYDSKFATVWEKATGHLAAKCGVTHSGQRHQLVKLERFMAAVGRKPDIVFVGFYVNDPANDAAYPHSTVIGGYQVDTVFLKDGNLVRPDPAELRAVVEEGLRRLAGPPAGIERVKTYVWVYSLSANIALQGLRVAQALLQPAPAALAEKGAGSPGQAPPVDNSRPTARFGDNLYYWYDPRTMKTRYATDPKTEANREAIVEWARHAKREGYKLVFLLFPPREAHDDAEFFGQVRAFLESNGIEYLDFAALFKAGGFGRWDLYWRTNGHWDAQGNRIVGGLLAERYR